MHSLVICYFGFIVRADFVGFRRNLFAYTRVCLFDTSETSPSHAPGHASVFRSFGFIVVRILADFDKFVRPIHIRLCSFDTPKPVPSAPLVMRVCFGYYGFIIAGGF